MWCLRMEPASSPTRVGGSLWVRLIFAEEPGAPALIGGALVLLAVVGYLVAPSGRRVALSSKKGPRSPNPAARLSKFNPKRWA